MRTALFWISFFLVLPKLSAGTPPVHRDFLIPAGQRVQVLDTLSIVADSFAIFGPDQKPLNEAFYQVDYMKATLELRIPEFWRQDSLRVSYRVWPLNFSAPVFAKDTSLIRLPGPGEDPLLLAVGSPFPEHGLLRFQGLESSGSISRGLTLGNRQDPVLNSAMNLQLHGMLTDDIEILAVVSDQNIPFQPDGTTQQIQDFDKVFVELKGFGGSLTAGDFELEKPPGHFLSIARKARGAKASWESSQSDTEILGGGQLKTTVAGAIARGKYARNQIQGIEGNQGPYKLTGNENEAFIVIMAGTERVYIDARPLQRGMDRDYVIDYNTAEITFMPSVMITRESRIVVEFEYAERNYARSMLFAGTELGYERGSFRLNFFSEQDHPNQSLFQEITPERRKLMQAVGDSIHLAFDWNLDSTGFQNDRIMYRLTDSLGYDTVFVYSTDPQQAVYALGFSFVGEGNGNYRQVTSNANGRVYQWQEPVNGIPQGAHEPVIQLVTPKKQQMVTLGGDVRISDHTEFFYEYALSQRDINLFSDLHKDDNLGHAFRVEWKDSRKASAQEPGGWHFTSRLSYEYTDKHFQPLERYRDVEFDRDWNVDQAVQPQSEHLPGFSFLAQHPRLGMARYSLRAFVKGDQYRGLINSMESRLLLNRNTLEYYGSLLNSSGNRSTEFYRHRTRYTRNLSVVLAGVEHQMEHNRIVDHASDTLSTASLAFDQWEFFVTNPDTAINQYRVFYKLRNDFLPVANAFELASKAHEYGLQYRYLRNPDQRPAVQFSYREFSAESDRMPNVQNQQTLNARLDYFSRWGNGVVTSNLFYETSSGREREREYMYVEVPAGQGIYVWNDYNGNGIMELDEFEVSPYPDEANFIRVFIPTDRFVPVYVTAISHSVHVDPAVAWRREEGWRKFVARFSNRLNYRIDNKKQGAMQARYFNPFFVNVEDSLLMGLNATVRNSLFFNRTHPVYSLEWTWQDNRNKNLMSNGFESRQQRLQILRSRVNFSRRISWHMLGEWGHKENESDYLVQRNYFLDIRKIEPSLNFQPFPQIRFSVSYAYEQQKNRPEFGSQKVQVHKAALEQRYSFPGRGQLQVRYQVSQIDFPHDPNTPVAFEMMQGLRQGTNHLWNVNWQHNLSSYMQLNLNYSGRKPSGLNAIHTGSVQLRALF